MILCIAPTFYGSFVSRSTAVAKIYVSDFAFSLSFHEGIEQTRPLKNFQNLWTNYLRNINILHSMKVLSFPTDIMSHLSPDNDRSLDFEALQTG